MDNTSVTAPRCVPLPPVASTAIIMIAERFQAIVNELRREAWHIGPYDRTTVFRLDNAATTFCATGAFRLPSHPTPR